MTCILCYDTPLDGGHLAVVCYQSCDIYTTYYAFADSNTCWTMNIERKERPSIVDMKFEIVRQMIDPACLLIIHSPWQCTERFRLVEEPLYSGVTSPLTRDVQKTNIIDSSDENGKLIFLAK